MFLLGRMMPELSDLIGEREPEASSYTLTAIFPSMEVVEESHARATEGY